METVRFYDTINKTVTEIPVGELAPGCIAAHVEGIEGTVFVEAKQMKPNPGYEHPPFDEEYKALFRQLAAAFADVYPQTPEQWENGFRKDRNPDKEIAWWANLGGAFNHFTEGNKLPLEECKDYFALCFAFFNNGAEAALQTVQLRRLTADRASAVIAELKEGHS